MGLDHEPIENTLLQAACGCYSFLCSIDDSEVLVGDHFECRRSLNFLIGAMESIHAFLHMGVILSPDMERFIFGVFDSVDEWMDEHEDYLIEVGFLVAGEF